MKKYKAQTRNLMRWEKKQAKGNQKIGFSYGLIIGAVAVLIGFIIGRL